MSALHSYSYCQYSSAFVLCESNKQKSHDKFIYQKIPFYSSVTCLALCKKKKCFEQNWFEGVLYLKSNEGWSRQINLKETIHTPANAEPYSHTGPKITLLIIQLQARVHSQFTAPPYPAQGISMCVHKYWAVRWKRGPLHSGMGVLTLNAWVTDYFLTSWTSTQTQREAWRGQTRNKGFPNNTKSQIGALRILRHYNSYSCSSSNFFFFFFSFTFPLPTQFVQL